MSNHQPELTASELSLLWTTYQSDSMAVCVIEYFMQNVEDPSIRELLQVALQISNGHVQKITDIFNAANYPIPQGFTEKDVHLNAPRLFTDTLYLQYLENIGKFGIESYGMALATTSRKDIYEFFSTAMNETIQLRKQATTLLQEKGLYHRDSILPTPEKIDFVKKQSFLTGFFGDKRPLLGTEISHLWFNSIRNGLGQAVIQGFSQVAKSKEIRQYFERGRDISAKHFDALGSILDENYLSRGAFNLTGHVTNSKEAPFSDKLMMFHITALIASAIGQYGIAMSVSPRRDLSAMYVRLSAEIMKYANDGAQIMIDHGWVEQPPEAADRRKLSK